MSWVTLHRIEKGEPAVTMGTYLSVLTTLGLKFRLVDPVDSTDLPRALDRTGWVPVRIRLADYPQLKRLAWQVQGTDSLTPAEAWDIYERNWWHLDAGALLERERQLIDALRLALGRQARHV